MLTVKNFLLTFNSLLSSKAGYNKEEMERLIGYAIVDSRLIEECKSPKHSDVYKCFEKFSYILDSKQVLYYREVNYEFLSTFRGLTYINRGSVYNPTIIYDWYKNQFTLASLAKYIPTCGSRLKLKLPLSNR